MADEEWSQNATEATSISLVRPTDDGIETVATFGPNFTYPIFGEQEQIFGYKGLKIDLRYHAHDMRPNCLITYDKKFKSVGDTEPLDVKARLQEHLPLVAFQSAKEFEAIKPPAEWAAPGKLHSTFEASDGTYEIRWGSLADPAIHQMVNRIELFSLLYIEGGSYIGRQPEADDPWKAPEDADRWTIFLLYKRSAEGKAGYTFVGYSTVYRFFYFQAPTPPASPGSDWDLPKDPFDVTDLPCRSRISQFVILPPFQGKGIGARLYSSIFQHYINHPQTKEIPVEDPNEAFDDMRDICDLTYLRGLPEFEQVRVNTNITIPRDLASACPRDIVDAAVLENLRLQTKIVSRQFSRVVEMHTMSQLPETVQPSFEGKNGTPTKEDKHQYRLWQLYVKQRIFRQNRDLLGQIDPPERLDKLNESLSSVELEYARILAAHARWARHSNGATGAGTKRKAAEDEDASSSKKVKVSEP